MKQSSNEYDVTNDQKQAVDGLDVKRSYNHGLKPRLRKSNFYSYLGPNKFIWRKYANEMRDKTRIK